MQARIHDTYRTAKPHETEGETIIEDTGAGIGQGNTETPGARDKRKESRTEGEQQCTFQIPVKRSTSDIQQADEESEASVWESSSSDEGEDLVARYELYCIVRVQGEYVVEGAIHFVDGRITGRHKFSLARLRVLCPQTLLAFYEAHWSAVDQAVLIPS